MRTFLVALYQFRLYTYLIDSINFYRVKYFHLRIICREVIPAYTLPANYMVGDAARNTNHRQCCYFSYCLDFLLTKAPTIILNTTCSGINCYINYPIRVR
jgi:hypothetical protein